MIPGPNCKIHSLLVSLVLCDSILFYFDYFQVSLWIGVVYKCSFVVCRNRNIRNNLDSSDECLGQASNQSCPKRASQEQMRLQSSLVGRDGARDGGGQRGLDPKHVRK